MRRPTYFVSADSFSVVLPSSFAFGSDPVLFRDNALLLGRACGPSAESGALFRLLLVCMLHLVCPQLMANYEQSQFMFHTGRFTL